MKWVLIEVIDRSMARDYGGLRNGDAGAVRKAIRQTPQS